jgi:hypothetical protein
MTHFDEHTLEVYVLGDHRGKPLERQIEAHLAECEGCRALVAELRAIHEDLAVVLSQERTPVSTGEALVRRRDDVEPFWEFRYPRRYVPKTPIQRVGYYIVKYPVAAAVAGISLAATLVFLGVLISATFKTSEAKPPAEDTNPAELFLNTERGTLEVHNAEGLTIWSKPLLGPVVNAEEESSGLTRSYLLDADGDGVRELVTSAAFRGSPELRDRSVHIIEMKTGLQRNFPVTRYAQYRGEKYSLPVQLGGPILTDTANFRTLGLFSVAGGGRSPSAIIRFDLQGNVIGEYWHFGGLFALYLRDVDGDGKNELIACAVNDVDDNLHMATPVAIVLDPEKIVNVTESSASPGFGYPVSRAERYYVGLPLSDLNTMFNVNASVSHLRTNEESLFLYVQTRINEGQYEFEYEFSPILRPRDVKPSTNTLNFYSDLKRKGKLERPLDREYRDRLLHKMRYWDGSTWSSEVVPVRPPASNP